MSAAIEAELRAIEEQRFQAMIANDFATLQALLGDDLIYTHSSSSVDDKASYLESLRSGRVRYRSVNRSEERIRVYGGSAVLTGRAVIEVSVQGQDKTLRMRYADVWVKRDAAWQMVLWQSTVIPA